MLKASYKTRCGRFQIYVEGTTQKDVFRELARASEVFDAASPCGLCNGDDTVLRVRVVDGNEFFESACLDCGAALHYGQHKAGETLFAKEWKLYKANGK